MVDKLFLRRFLPMEHYASVAFVLCWQYEIQALVTFWGHNCRSSLNTTLEQAQGSERGSECTTSLAAAVWFGGVSLTASRPTYVFFSLQLSQAVP